MILDECRHLLLQRRSDNGQWGLPGGPVEIGESVTEAILREVREETGLLIDVVRLIGVYSDPRLQIVRYPDGRVVRYINTCFECRIVSGELRTYPETLEPACFDPVVLPHTMVPLHAIRIRDALRRGAPAVIR
jgi:ADP-ribose pyrophosphatase YjhB (NUDIX family)